MAKKYIFEKPVKVEFKTISDMCIHIHRTDMTMHHFDIRLINIEKRLKKLEVSISQQRTNTI